MFNSIQSLKIQQLQDHMSKAIDMAILIVDFKGVPVTQHSNCTDFCKVLRQNAKTRDLCQKCDSRGGLEAARLHEPYSYLCHQGLVDLAVPIMVDGHYQGAIMAGQVRLQLEEEKHFLEVIAGPMPLDAIAFYEASAARLKEKLPAMTLEKIKAIGNMLFELSQLIAMQLKNNALDSQAVSEQVTVSYETSTLPVVIDPFKKVAPAYHFLTPALERLAKEPNNRFSVEMLAKLCNVSEGYFSKSFLKATGFKFSAYQNQLKMQQAETLLKESDLSIAEISYDLGYDSSSYFIRIFKQYFGVTPNYYRESYFEKKNIQYRY